MLPKKNRLKKKKDFEKVFREGKGFGEKLLFLKVKKSNQEETKVGFIVPKKYFKKAVLRNKIKRRLREQIRKRLPRVKKGCDIVVVAKPGLQTLSFWEIDERLEKLLSKANLI